ncbi:MAG: glycosyltransferase family 4 protein [Proteobacteria bacterium]|nr:glycosyltransferase family 4 protein [Pseudomonadota bacterium]
MVPAAVDLLEQFAARNRTLAFCLFKFFPFGGLQRDFMKVASEAQRRGYLVRVYAISWEGEVPPGFDVKLMPDTLHRVTNHRTLQRFAGWAVAQLSASPVALVIGFNRMPGLDVYYAADSCFEEKTRRLRSTLYRRTPRYRVFARFEKVVFRRGAQTRILLLTDKQRGEFRQHYDTEPERMVLLPPGLGRDRVRPANADVIRRQFRDEFGLADDDLLLLLIGSGFITKGLDRAIRALASLPAALKARCRFMIIGQDRAGPFIRLAETLNIGDRVQFMSGRDDVPRFLLGADLMLHPAVAESGGMVLLEALICGLPVIVTDTCGFASYISDAHAGVVLSSPFDQQQLNDTLRATLTDPARRACWSGNGVAYGRQADLFSMAERAMDHIEATLEGRT